ncbi:MAG: uroporphyrinogen-III synthase [Ramlibacter sp.]|nr:uroporphyrinogen-III synthase [Ramlibacter sp.]
MRVLVTRPEQQASRWTEQLCGRGFDAVALPLIEIAPAPRPQALHRAWQELGRFRAVMFVSGNAVRHFFAHRPNGACWPRGTRAWAPGNGTGEALIGAGVGADLLDAPGPNATQFDSQVLWPQVAGQVRAGDRVLIVRGDDARAHGAPRDWLAAQLGAAGARVQAVAAYVRATPVLDEAQRAHAMLGVTQGVWLFSSSQAIANLQQLLPTHQWTRARAVVTHSRIADVAHLAGFGVVCESRPTLESVAAALESFR